MKRYGIFITALCSGWLLTGCADDENLGLTDYPAAAIGVSIAGEKSETVVMAAAYDENGLLQVDGDLAREYTVELATASPEDIRVVVEPVATNIPAEAIVVSETDLWFPAGTVRRSVSVSLADADFGFAQAERGGMTYELGLRIAAVSNPNVVMERSEAKVVVDKEAYRATCTLRGEGDTSFSRPYWDGKVFSDEPISHTFKAVLDRPASADTKITFSSAGLDEQYAGMVTVVPAELIIPAGARESAESAVWTLSNGYLEQTEPLNYTLSLLPVVTSDDPAAVAGEGLTFAVSKALQAFALAESVPAEWSLFDRSGWSAKGEFDDPDEWDPTDPAQNVLDGDPETGWRSYKVGRIYVDMQSAHELAGFSVNYLTSQWGDLYSALRVDIYISDDNATWTSLGSYSVELAEVHTFRIHSPMQTRYIKLEFEPKKNPWGFYATLGITELEIYGAR